MAYSTGNPPRMFGGSVAGGPRLWLYDSSDTVAAVAGAAGYFSNGKALGMLFGDLVFVHDNKTNNWASVGVVSTSTTGSVTPSTQVALATSAA